MFSSDQLESFFPQLINLKKSNTTYLDSAATSLKYGESTKTQFKFDLEQTSNVHRGSYKLSSEATYRYEEARTKVAEYLNCKTEQIVFTKGTTESVNMIADSLKETLKENDCILVSEMEHHANLIPWQNLAETTGATLLLCTVNANGELDLEEIRSLFKKHKIKITSLCHVSNTLGTENPIEEIQKICLENDSLFFVDGAQAISITKPDMNKIHADFYAFSAHKLFGPFGLGVLFVKDINKITPYQLGGGIIDNVEFKTSTFLSGPQKMEAGTPNISGIIALTPLINFLNTINFQEVANYERELLKEAENQLSLIDGFQVIGKSKTKNNILSFNFENIHPNDLCELLDEQGLALRAGHHCTQPLLRKMGVGGCARASFSIYNNKEDVDKLTQAVKKSVGILR